MRLRRLSAAFWAMTIVVILFVLYTLTDLSFKLPNIKPAMEEFDDSKLSLFEVKLQHLENELTQHHAVVGEIKTAVDQMMQSREQYASNEILEPPKKSRKEKKLPFDNPVPAVKPQVKFDESVCPIEKYMAPKTDIQMLSMYERLIFDDKDGGVWKQGWKIEYDDKQWSRQNKLKVFIVPHSHNDPGWIKTFENYYKTQTRAIFDNMVEKMHEGYGRKFIWAEISFLSLWWQSDATPEQKLAFKELVTSGKIEIVTGGWVMNDEANCHWLSIAQQLTAGHQWLLNNLDYQPVNGWSIDPFGMSSTQPYLLRLAGLQNAVIQRVHYRIKKELASNRQLEFKWRQVWDGVGKTDLFTHMMPFYSYDVPHTCGPDPSVCCQFDFKRLPGNGVTCPWNVAPKKIIQKNVNERAFLILDQWRKKAQLYRSNVLLVPLGDDFRYDRAAEWDNQYTNYQMLIDYINNKDMWNAEVQFGTLSDYFKAVHEELSSSNVPVLSGDFFTYADRNQHYWSGYYTSRPFYKSMDRVLLAYVRAAETITGQASVSGAVGRLQYVQLRDSVEAARRALSLFQHHDGVTGTSRDDVMQDYARKLLQAIKHCQSAIQQSAYYLLGKPELEGQTQDDIFFDVDDVWRQQNEVPTRITITLDMVMPKRQLVFYNSLTFARQEIVTVIVNTPHIELHDPEGNPQMSQVSPVISGEQKLSIANNKFQLSFLVTVPPLGLATYTVSLRDEAAINKYTYFAKVRLFNSDYMNVDLPSVFQVEQSSTRLKEDVAIRAGNGTKVVFSPRGVVKTIVTRDGSVVPVHMDFVTYESQKGPDNNSGPYLFIPVGGARALSPAPYPELAATQGPLKATLYAALVAHNAADIVLAMSVYDNPSLRENALEVCNMFRLSSRNDDIELAMRFSTSIRNEDVFYTDLNGMQMVKRRYLSKLPLQANYYPFSSAAYVQDAARRLTLLTSAPLGLAALAPGQIEVMQDRRLSRDDNRGMNQGVLDNVRTRHVLRLIVENAADCAQKPSADRPAGQLTLGAHVSQQMLLHPLVRLHGSLARSQAAPLAPLAPLAQPLPADVVLASYHNSVSGKNPDGNLVQGVGLTFHRVHLESCYGDPSVTDFYTLGDGLVSISNVVGSKRAVYNSSLTYTFVSERLASDTFPLCPMEVRSVFLAETAPAH